MGEAKQVADSTKEAAQPEAKQTEAKEEEKKDDKAEQKKEEAKLSPPSPTVLIVDLHCVGCAQKIQRSIMKCRGVEEVEVDMEQNRVTVKGIVDPGALCSRIQEKTMRKAQVVASQVGGLETVELHVDMHCQACAQQLRAKILKMRGVHSAETELSTGRVTATGTMNADALADYIHRHTGKLARLIPLPSNEAEKKKPEEGKDEKIEEKKHKKEDAVEEERAPQEQGNARGRKGAEDKEEDGGVERPNTEEKGQDNSIVSKEGMAKKMVYWYGGVISDEEMARMVPWMPIYVMERPPPPAPQLFSDENPNACCIS